MEGNQKGFALGYRHGGRLCHHWRAAGMARLNELFLLGMALAFCIAMVLEASNRRFAGDCAFIASGLLGLAALVATFV